MKRDNFYCKREAGNPDVTIEEWNRRYAIGLKMGLTDEQISDFLGESKCKEQCVDCACIVGERRLKTKKLMKNIMLRDSCQRSE